jgi:hypothetical protein
LLFSGEAVFNPTVLYRTDSMDAQSHCAAGSNVPLGIVAPVSAVSSAIQANDAHRAALNARRALLKRQLENGDIMLENMDKFVDPTLEEVRVRNLDEWAVFAIGASAVRPLLTNKQLNADVRILHEDHRRICLIVTRF